MRSEGSHASGAWRSHSPGGSHAPAAWGSRSPGGWSGSAADWHRGGRLSPGPAEWSARSRASSPGGGTSMEWSTRPRPSSPGGWSAPPGSPGSWGWSPGSSAAPAAAWASRQPPPPPEWRFGQPDGFAPPYPGAAPGPPPDGCLPGYAGGQEDGMSCFGLNRGCFGAGGLLGLFQPAADRGPSALQAIPRSNAPARRLQVPDGRGMYEQVPAQCYYEHPGFLGQGEPYGGASGGRGAAPSQRGACRKVGACTLGALGMLSGAYLVSHAVDLRDIETQPESDSRGLQHVRGTLEEDPHDCNVDVAFWEVSWSDEKKRWCCGPPGCPPAAPAAPAPALPAGGARSAALPARQDAGGSCGASCVFEGRSASCQERIQYAADHAFAQEPDACVKAYRLVLHHCEPCTWCPLEAAGCSPAAGAPPPEPPRAAPAVPPALPAASAPPPPPRAPAPAAPSPPAPPPAPPAPAPPAPAAPWAPLVVPRPAGGGCDPVCSARGVSATCRSRVHYAMGRDFLGQPAACTSALGLVRRQCDACHSCTLEQVGCAELGGPDGPSGVGAEEAVPAGLGGPPAAVTLA